MDKLWAPWRNKYITSKKQKGCVFCKALKKDKADFLVFKTGFSLCILNIFPYNNGHLMVSPQRHVKDISELKEIELLDLFKAINTAKKLLEKTLKPHGYNIGMNISQDAGAGIAGHIHIHIVPRWRADTNFMPALFNTKIISQSLKELQRKLKITYAKSDKN